MKRLHLLNSQDYEELLQFWIVVHEGPCFSQVEERDITVTLAPGVMGTAFRNAANVLQCKALTKPDDLEGASFFIGAGPAS